MNNSSDVSQNAFYQAYDRRGQGTVLKTKHIRQFRNDFVRSAGFSSHMSVLELGCGNGLFLKFLKHEGVRDFLGVDGDARVKGEMPEDIAAHVQIDNFADFFAACKDRTFDRIVLFDVLEHFAPEDAVALLSDIRRLLADDGRVVLRVPNMSSPLGLAVQYNDMTHLSAFTPGSLRQVASLAGFDAVSFGPQAYTSAFREFRERLLTRVLSWFLAMPPQIWSPNFIAVLKKTAADGGSD